MSQRQSCTLGHKEIQYVQEGSGFPLLFLPGFGIKPEFYQPLFEAFTNTYQIISPDLMRSNRHRDQPTTPADIASLIQEFCNALELEAFHVAGHSMGGASALHLADRDSRAKKVICLNPALPVNFGARGFMARSLWKSVRQYAGREGLKGAAFAHKFHAPFLYHVARDPGTSVRFLQQARHTSFAELNLSQPALVIFGEKDEYFQMTSEIRAQLNEAAQDLTIHLVTGASHDWPIFSPESGAETMLRFLS